MYSRFVLLRRVRLDSVFLNALYVYEHTCPNIHVDNHFQPSEIHSHDPFMPLCETLLEKTVHALARFAVVATARKRENKKLCEIDFAEFFSSASRQGEITWSCRQKSRD